MGHYLVCIFEEAADKTQKDIKMGEAEEQEADKAEKSKKKKKKNASEEDEGDDVDVEGKSSHSTVNIGIVAVQTSTGDIIYDSFQDGFMRSELGK